MNDGYKKEYKAFKEIFKELKTFTDTFYIDSESGIVIYAPVEYQRIIQINTNALEGISFFTDSEFMTADVNLFVSCVKISKPFGPFVETGDNEEQKLYLSGYDSDLTEYRIRLKNPASKTRTNLVTKVDDEDLVYEDATDSLVLLNAGEAIDVSGIIFAKECLVNPKNTIRLEVAHVGKHAIMEDVGFAIIKQTTKQMTVWTNISYLLGSN